MADHGYPSVSYFRKGWENLVDDLKAEKLHDAASSLRTAITYAESTERAIDQCIPDDAMRYASAVSWNIKDIRMNKDIDLAKRTAIVSEFEAILKDQRSRFVKTCICTKRKT